jgi:AraC-like DNA-binding protein
LQFNSEFNAIVVMTCDLDRTNVKADTALAVHARQLLESAMSLTPGTAAEDVDQLIRLLMPAGRATIQVCAASMGVTVRTLQRKLDTEGESFSALLNGARMQLATEYMTNRSMRITDIADLLGYGSIGAFTRWHTQIFGYPPRDARKLAACDKLAR